MERRQVLGGLLAAGIVPLAGCQLSLNGGGERDSDPDTQGSCELQRDRQHQAQILQHSLGTAKYSGATRVVGKIKNTGDLRITHAEIKATFYRKNGSVIATGVDRRFNIDPGETQTFRVFPPTDEMPVNVSAVDEYDLSLGVVQACVPT